MDKQRTWPQRDPIFAPESLEVHVQPPIHSGLDNLQLFIAWPFCSLSLYIYGYPLNAGEEMKAWYQMASNARVKFTIIIMHDVMICTTLVPYGKNNPATRL